MAYDETNPTATVEREAPPQTAEPTGPTAAQAAERSGRTRAGIRDVIGGLVLIGIGFAYGGSVFTGNADVIDWAFDILGSFWVLKGIYLLIT
ncbi:MAG: hypothetical protein ACYTEZ_07410 [Planctomycetota bacterium]|jgi:hypothetical protein